MKEVNNKKEKPVKIWRGKYIHLVNEENDIKFRGPLSYRHLRIFGWIFLILAQLGTLLTIASNAKLVNINPGFLAVLQSASSLMTPLFLFAAFAQILVVKDGYRRLLITYSAGAIGFFLVFLFVFLHYVVGIFASLSGSWNEGYATAKDLIQSLNYSGTLSFNIFIDLVLCALVTFFINYTPTVHFQGKKIYIFRAFVILPILYEIGSITLKMLGSITDFMISPYLIPLLTTKPPVAFFIFIVLAIFIKVRERYYNKKGKTHAEYKKFLNTNVNRLHFSISLSLAVLGAVALDLVLFISLSAGYAALLPQDVVEVIGQDGAISLGFETVYGWGFGRCLSMLLIIPILMFFDYTKTYKGKLGDIIIPVGGIAVILAMYVEGLFLIASNYLAKMATEDTPDTKESARLLIETIKARFRK